MALCIFLPFIKHIDIWSFKDMVVVANYVLIIKKRCDKIVLSTFFFR